MLHPLPVLSLTLVASLGVSAAVASEEPGYRVLEKAGDFELRQYPAMLAAETLVTGADFDEAGGVAFGRLFGYISGNNRARAEIAMTAPVVQAASRPGKRAGEKIAMTAPVTQQPRKPGEPAAGYRVAFMMPAEYTRETVPEPLDPDVRIVATPARLVAALRYSGWTSEDKHARKEQALRTELATRQLVITGEGLTAQYDAPFVPGPFRRNEVLIPVSRQPVGGEPRVR
jgi:hypothetical protein